jgi:hypothetical protein
MRYGAALIRAAAAALALSALCATASRGVEQPRVALAFGLVIAVGEALRVRLPGAGPAGRAPLRAPLAASGALGYALLGHVAGRPASHGVLQCVAVVIVAALVGLAPRLARGRAPEFDSAVRVVLAVGFAAVCFRPVESAARGGALAEWPGWLVGPVGPQWPDAGPSYALCLLLVTALTALFDALLAALLTAGRTGWPFRPLLRDCLSPPLSIAPALAATGAVIALAVAVAGLWALPVFSVPLLLAQLSFRRYASARATYRQTIASLARATEVAGHTPHGHARRVAALSRAVGRELGLAEPELTVLEYAALMHDIGQLSLVDPVEGGATESLETRLRRRIALHGGAVVRQTGVASEVAVVVERQAEPYRDQPLTARIVRTVNAYEDMVAGKGTTDGPRLALECLRRGGANDHDPRVVEALAQVLAAGGHGASLR